MLHLDSHDWLILSGIISVTLAGLTFLFVVFRMVFGSRKADFVAFEARLVTGLEKVAGSILAVAEQLAKQNGRIGKLEDWRIDLAKSRTEDMAEIRRGIEKQIATFDRHEEKESDWQGKVIGSISKLHVAVAEIRAVVPLKRAGVR